MTTPRDSYKAWYSNARSWAKAPGRSLPFFAEHGRVRFNYGYRFQPNGLQHNRPSDAVINRITSLGCAEDASIRSCNARGFRRLSLQDARTYRLQSERAGFRLPG